MIPNKFVILWEDQPIAIVNKFPIAPYAKKTDNPHEIYWFDVKSDAHALREKMVN